jgi:two-component system, OmpR family, sensor kinase
VTPLLTAALSLQQITDTRFLFWISVAVLLSVTAFATALFAVLLRRSYGRRLEEQKLAMVGTVTARILHQLKNPLQSLILQAELLQEFDRSDAAELRTESAEAIANEAHRLAKMLDELSVWASGSRRSLELEPGALHEVVGDFARRVGYQAAQAGIRLRTEIRSEAVARIDGFYLQQAIENLTRNAQEALAGVPDAEIRMELDRTDTVALIRVIDNGPGIPPERRDAVFEAFVSGKTTGMGLGLAICREIVEGHGGTLSLESTPAGGAMFTISLPLATEPGRRAAFAPAERG